MRNQFAVFQKRKANLKVLKKDHISGCRSGQVKTKDIGMFFLPGNTDDIR